MHGSRVIYDDYPNVLKTNIIIFAFSRDWQQILPTVLGQRLWAARLVGHSTAAAGRRSKSGSDAPHPAGPSRVEPSRVEPSRVGSSPRPCEPRHKPLIDPFYRFSPPFSVGVPAADAGVKRRLIPTVCVRSSRPVQLRMRSELQDLCKSKMRLELQDSCKRLHCATARMEDFR